MGREDVRIRGHDETEQKDSVARRPEEQEDTDEATRPRLHLVLNWFEELNERVPTDR